MKKILFLSAIALMLLQACEKHEAPDQDGVSAVVKQALENKYPEASNVTWHSKNGYMVANFMQAMQRSAPSTELDAWFDNQGVWYMTETDIRFEQLPEAVKISFAASAFAAWRVDDVDKIERNGTETVYVIEVDSAAREMDLYYSPDGVLVKEMADMDDGYDYEDYIPIVPNTSIDSYIKANYPSARILEIDREGNYTEVEILDGRTKRELLFDTNDQWQRTKTELSVVDVPAVIMQVLHVSQYGSYRIKDVDHFISKTAEYYHFELKSASGDVDIQITQEGILTVVGNEPSDDDDYIGSINQNCVELITKQYPGAVILASEYERGYLEVEIRHDNREKTVRFNASSVWVDTQWDIRQSELPQVVKNAIAASVYASYAIDDVEYFQTPSGDYYEIELEKGDREVTMCIKADGTVM